MVQTEETPTMWKSMKKAIMFSVASNTSVVSATKQNKLEWMKSRLKHGSVQLCIFKNSATHPARRQLKLLPESRYINPQDFALKSFDCIFSTAFVSPFL